jgi:hypothetical protein
MMSRNDENVKMSNVYQPKVSSSSNLNLFSVALVRHQKNKNISDSRTFKLNNTIKNNANIIRLKYSLNIIIEKYKLLNSVINPATSSDSASIKSKGTLLDSTNIQRLNTMNKKSGK